MFATRRWLMALAVTVAVCDATARAADRPEDPKVEEAVAAGLKWLSLHQSPDGSWQLHAFNKFARAKVTDPFEKASDDKSTGQGIKADVAGTALGVLPFLAAGHTHKRDREKKDVDYSKTVEAAVKFLLKKQEKDGAVADSSMYSHGLATLALCEAYGLTADPALKDPAQKALDYIVKAQDAKGGGWRYSPGQAGDTSVTGWQMQALKSGQLAGLKVPAQTLKAAGKFLDGVASSDGGDYGYMDAAKTRPTDKADGPTAVGLLCRQLLGWSPRNEGLKNGISRIKLAPPGDAKNSYYTYYATLTMHNAGGDDAAAWNDKLREHLLKTQDAAGSWDPKPDRWGKEGGRVMVTSLSLLALETPSQQLPLFRRDAPAPPDDK